MKIILKHKQFNDSLIFENKSELIEYINDYLYNKHFTSDYLNKVNMSNNKNKYTVNDLSKLFMDYNLECK